MREYYNKQEVIKEMCKLITEVGEHFKHEYSHDCICGANSSGAMVDCYIIDFIKLAVRIKMNEEKND